jgi:hypothetical protein
MGCKRERGRESVARHLYIYTFWGAAAKKPRILAVVSELIFLYFVLCWSSIERREIVVFVGTTSWCLAPARVCVCLFLQVVYTLTDIQ